jgi:FixJ family two-component response regulator
MPSLRAHHTRGERPNPSDEGIEDTFVSTPTSNRSRSGAVLQWRAELTRESDVKINRPLVSVVDDNESVRESLPDLLQYSGFDVHAFASAEAFLESGSAEATSCLILDIALPGMSGPDLHQELKRRGLAIPVVFITAQDDKSLSPRLVARGATACLFKPFSDTALVEAVNDALGMR